MSVSTSSRRGREGFGLLSAVFLLVVLAVAGAAMVNVAGSQRSAVVLAVQQARAFEAARSGIEWGVWQVLDTGACPASTTLNLTEGGVTGFDVAITCTSSGHTEGVTPIAVYQLVAVAEYATYGDPDYVRRRIQVSVTDAS